MRSNSHDPTTFIIVFSNRNPGYKICGLVNLLRTKTQKLVLHLYIYNNGKLYLSQIFILYNIIQGSSEYQISVNNPFSHMILEYEKRTTLKNILPDILRTLFQFS